MNVSQAFRSHRSSIPQQVHQVRPMRDCTMWNLTILILVGGPRASERCSDIDGVQSHIRRRTTDIHGHPTRIAGGKRTCLDQKLSEWWTLSPSQASLQALGKNTFKGWLRPTWFKHNRTLQVLYIQCDGFLYTPKQDQKSVASSYIILPFSWRFAFPSLGINTLW